MENACEDNSAETTNIRQKISDIVVMDSESYVNVECDMEKFSGVSEVENSISAISQGL